MQIVGFEWLLSLAEQGGFSAKLVCNENGAIFFATTLQHRDQKITGVSYEDNYVGNAVAAMVSPGRIEIRFHRDFSEERIRSVVRSLLADSRLSFMVKWQVTYQGKPIAL